MHGDFTRWTFDPREGYRSVLMQQGRVLLDSDWNEQAALTAHHDETRTRDVVGEHGGPIDGAGFAVVDHAGGTPGGTAWEDLELTPGSYAVHGIRVETAVDAGSIPLVDQPFLPQIAGEPGLAEPPDDGRYGLVLDVFTHHVTRDEQPSLLESALGGPDTTTRARTVWQVWAAVLDDDASCADLAALTPAEPRLMVAGLVEGDPSADPCVIGTAGGYDRLENQLYRVQVYDVDESGDATFVWSRENGSVVAGLVALETTPVAGMDVALVVDREGRDDPLSFHDGDLVEVTSTDRALHGLPGYLGTLGPPDGLTLPVAWSADSPSDVASLGAAPIVRRWDGGPLPLNSAWRDLEGGIRVRFPAGGDSQVGQYWLIPARTVRLVYGVTALAGTIEWPTAVDGTPLPRPPIGPVHRWAPIALLDRTTVDGQGEWDLVTDCRSRTPTLSDLVTLDLLGGDGQHAAPGAALPEPVRVIVRNGAVPVEGAVVRFETTGALTLPSADPTAADPSVLDVVTGSDGYAEVRWRLADAGPTTQVLTAARLDDAGGQVGAEVRVTGSRVDVGDGYCRRISPGEDLVAVLASLSEGPSVVLCLPAGVWTVEEPAVLSGVASVEVHGVGPDTRIESRAETAVRLERCSDVHVHDLRVQGRDVGEGDDIGGALDIRQARTAHVARVEAVAAGGPARRASGITVRSDQRIGEVDAAGASRVVVRDCRVSVGDHQTGILVVDTQRADVTGNEVRAVRDPQQPRPTLEGWLTDAGFAREVARRLVHGRFLAEFDTLGLRREYSQRIEVENLEFGSEIRSRDFWFSVAGNVRDVDALATQMRDELMGQRRLFADGRTAAGRWFRERQADVEAGPVAGRGIVVAGSVGADVRVVDNSVTDALHGITVALSDTDPEMEVIHRVQVCGNTIRFPLRSATGYLEPAIFVGHVRHLRAEGNAVAPVSGGEPAFPTEGLVLDGRLGRHALVAGNAFQRTVDGIRVVAGQVADEPRLHVARDNVATHGTVLIDSAGTFVSRDNVGV